MSKYAGLALQAISRVTTLGSKDETAKYMVALQELFNRAPRFNEIRAMMNDLSGITDDNDGLLSW